MMRASLAVGLLILLSGCLAQAPNETPSAQGPPSNNGAGPSLAEESMVLGRLRLHNDGTHMWMDSQREDDLPLPAATASTQGNAFSFPYEPTLMRDVATAGFAQIAIVASTTVALVGNAPVFKATAVVDGVPVGSVSGRGSGNVFAIPMPPTIRAGSELALELCFCGDGTDVSAVVFEPADSYLEILAPSAAACTDGSLTPGPSQVTQQGNQWVASRTDHGTGGAPQHFASLALTTHNGNLDLRRTGTGNYALEARLEARGNTADEAQARLDAMCIDIERSGDGASLSAHLVATDGLSQPWNNRGASIALDVPGASAGEVHLDASNGDIDVAGLQIDVLEADTSNGGLTVQGEVQDLALDTSNAQITLDGAFGDIAADTSNGGISLTARPLGNGGHDWVLTTSNAGIEADVATGPDIGYDATGSTSNADVTLDLPDSQAVGSQRDTSKHVRTNGYDARPQRIELTLDTSNADIDLQG